MTMAERFYRLLLRLYPQPYLSLYGEPMAQVFRDQLRAAGAGLGRWKVIAAALADLARTVPQQHEQERTQPMRSLKLHVFVLFAVMMLFLARFELRTDDAGMVVLLTGLFAFVLGYLNPAQAKLWALVGVCVPLVHVVVRPGTFIIEPQRGPGSMAGLALLGLLMLAVGATGSYLGIRARRGFAQPVA